MSGKMTRPVLTLETMEDAHGNRAADEFVEALQATEDDIQRYIARYDGAVPDGKYEITLKVQVEANGETTRDLTWEIIQKRPKQSMPRIQKVRSREGVLVAGMPVRQTALPLERVTAQELAATLEDE